MSTENVNKQKIDQELYFLLMTKIKKGSRYITMYDTFNIGDNSVNYHYEGWFAQYIRAERFIQHNIKESYSFGYILTEDSKHHVVLAREE